MSDIKVFSLVSGESIIAELLRETPEVYFISNPYSGIVGSSGSALIPFCPIGETTEMSVFKKFVVAEPVEPKQVVLDAYRGITGKVVLLESKRLLN